MPYNDGVSQSLSAKELSASYRPGAGTTSQNKLCELSIFNVGVRRVSEGRKNRGERSEIQLKLKIELKEMSPCRDFYRFIKLFPAACSRCLVARLQERFSGRN